LDSLARPAMTHSVCYLCGKRTAAQAQTGDHIVPKTLLEGQPPKVRGFEYGGQLPTHKKCNNEFGPESYAQRALELLDALHNSDCTIKFRHEDDPEIPLMALNSACLPNFTKRDLKYFKIMDRQAHGSSAARPSVEALRLIEPVDPFKAALDTALAVLFKSAAALVIRKTKLVPRMWHVMAVPYVGDASAVDFDELLGPTNSLRATPSSSTELIGCWSTSSSDCPAHLRAGVTCEVSSSGSRGCALTVHQ
jgi:hypothetical protein